MYQIDPTKQTEILRWLMYAWDGQWLGRTAAVYGPAEASKINSKVRSAFGKIEMKALLALVGKKQAANLADAAELLKTYFELAYGERGFAGHFLPVEAAPGGNARLQIEVRKLTPFDALKKVAQAAGEDPAAICEMLWTTWLETLLPEADLQVTLRPNSTAGGDLYQIDNLNEQFSPTAALASASLFEPDYSRLTPASPPSPVPVGPAIPATPPADENHIASVLQIPLDQIAPAFDPYASGPASFQVPLAPGPINGSHQLHNPVPVPEVSPRKGGRVDLSSLADTSAIPNPPFGSAGNALPSPDFSLATTTPAPSAGPNTIPVPDFDWNQSGTAPAPLSVPGLNIDSSTGRPLFSSDAEQDAKQKYSREKPKNMPLLSRMMMSKQAKEMLSTSSTPAPRTLSVATSIDLILQRLLTEQRPVRPGVFPAVLRVVGGPQGELQIFVGTQIFYGVDEIPAGPVRDVLSQAVQEWSEAQ